ncbi:endonuclease/exonuclease/phosphatase family protein [Wenzhouxiangella sp. AB-CW3]|uniref:endonuclease/exonuclease/phosphatase family protein n=1 Tax=Wenzhouxiangella sp. AB-CW3 TaxID=2771012 RepID=UPI00168B4E39|nr:endonuclease/exonuclease/phosphatase family protein [Wenzhouxiangella sp. AB-CW3]QOC22331.1 endonuclease/exonuclease/phosphatase family protein [Wenzhouxiangella sp. AB-CW3]
MVAPSRQLRLLSYNIQAGTTTGRYSEYVTRSWRQVLPNNQRIANLDAISELVADYDIVALQEVDCGSLRSGFLNQAKYLATHARFPFWNHQGNRKVGMIAHAGNGLLSRVEPSAIEEHKLPGAIPGRGAMVVRFGEGDAALWLVVLHLALGRRARAQQLDYIAGLVREYPHVVAMGDLNTGPDSRELRSFCDKAGLIIPDSHLTFPSWRPQRAIDHILVSPNMDIAELEVLPVSYSDHRPLSMVVNLHQDVDLPDAGGHANGDDDQYAPKQAS